MPIIEGAGSRSRAYQATFTTDCKAPGLQRDTRLSAFRLAQHVEPHVALHVALHVASLKALSGRCRASNSNTTQDGVTTDG